MVKQSQQQPASRGKRNPNDRVIARARVRQDKNQVRTEVEAAQNVPAIRAALVKIMDIIGMQ